LEQGAVTTFFKPGQNHGDYENHHDLATIHPFHQMKAATLFPSLVLIFTTQLLGSCATFEGALNPAENSGAEHPLWGNNGQGNDCSHHQNYMGGASGNYPFSMRGEQLDYCHKCGRYVRGRH
jgi:hypothetical protein